MNPEAYKKYLESERLRKNHANLLKKMFQHNDTLTSSSTSISTAVPESSSAIPATPTPATPMTGDSNFSTKQARNRSLLKAEKGLPKSPRKKAEIIKKLATKYQLRINPKENRGRPGKCLDDNQKEWLLELINRSDITYTNPGSADNVYIGKFEGKRKYLSKQYLMWLRELLDIVNGTNELIDTDEYQKFEDAFHNCMTLLNHIRNSFTIKKISHTHHVFVRYVKLAFFLRMD